ncbi:hypothetical protein D3C78_1638340 [compost metagenome]
MARQPVTAVGKHHGPRHIGWPAPKLAIDEVAQAAKPQAQRNQRRDEIADREKGQLFLSCKEKHDEDHADQAAVERHAALPQVRHFQRMR